MTITFYVTFTFTYLNLDLFQYVEYDVELHVHCRDRMQDCTKQDGGWCF
jgi:hypothetical protein